MSTQAQDAGPARTTLRRALAIEARDLVKTYPKGIRALDGLSFTVQEGTVFGLLGPNGAGKSTTVKILTTLAQADSGTASVAGLDVRAQAAAVRRAIGVVAQRSGADPTATGRENLLLSGRIQGLRGRELGRRADELLARFDLADAAGRMVRTYSGGMQRRLDVAMGLIHRPEVLFLDEPTAGLDPESRSAMWDEIARLSAGEGLTILLTTHYLEEADRLASQLAIVERGPVVAAGSPDELKARLHGDTVHVELAGPGDPAQLDAVAAPGPGGPRGQRDRDPAERPGRRRRHDPARPAHRAGAGRDRGARDHRRPPLARRRVPALRRAAIRRGRGAGPGRQPARPEPVRRKPMTTIATHTTWMTQRQLKALVRQPAYLIIQIIQPAIWLFLFGSLFRKVAELPGFGAPSYLDYLVPGVVVMSALSTSMWSGMTVLEEIDRGIMDRFLVLPLRRSAIINASVVMQSIGTVIQSLIIVGLGLAAGARYPGGAAGIIVLLVVSVLVAVVFSALSNTIGMLARQRETIIGLSVFLLLPLTFLSTAFMAPALMPHWMRIVADCNPVNWALEAARAR